MEDWDRFDVFKVARLTDGRPLQTVGLNLLRKRGLIGKLQLAEDRLAAFLQARRGGGVSQMVGGRGISSSGGVAAGLLSPTGCEREA